MSKAGWSAASASREERLSALLLLAEVNQLNAAYAAALDEKRFDDWPLFFVEDGHYTVQAREILTVACRWP